MNDDEQGVHEQSPVGRVAERVARRDLFTRGGKWAFASAVAGWFLGSAREGRAGSVTVSPKDPPVDPVTGMPVDSGALVLLTDVAPDHPSESVHCELIGFGCDCILAECRRNGNVCTPRYGRCPSGGYCWTQCNGVGQKITCCDWTCAGYPCHCCKVISQTCP
jgi:hypothetical protein